MDAAAAKVGLGPTQRVAGIFVNSAQRRRGSSGLDPAHDKAKQ